jgi:hypothetical protein
MERHLPYCRLEEVAMPLHVVCAIDDQGLERYEFPEQLSIHTH